MSDVIDKPTITEKPAQTGLMLAALGIVYGDLGTSPLYTYQTLVGTLGGKASVTEALGLLSLVVWALILTVSVKYCLVVMRADNHGEGGILALMAIVAGDTRRLGLLTVMGLFGAALIYGDGIITPAISVLSALEGINVVTDQFKPYIVPAALVILVGLFGFQAVGTAKIGRIFGPIMLVWFVIIGLLGVAQILRRPDVLVALSPTYAVHFLIAHRWHSFVALGGVFLAITGGEALYADMGHIGRRPIRFAWFSLVLPALLLSYAGQTALLLETPDLDGNPFFKLAPSWAVVPLVVLAMLATIIASQAIITGAFSLTRQAMQLGFFPGLRIRQTSSEEYGQIYVPVVNWVMMVCTLALTFGFGSSDKLAGAYGTAVSTTMLLTTALLFDVMVKAWRWPLVVAYAVAGGFLVLDLAFFGANLLKILDGGWIPLVLGALLFTVMVTWRVGVVALRSRLSEGAETPEVFAARIRDEHIPRVPGTAVFLSRMDELIPPVVACHVKQMKALQETVLGLTVFFTETPRVEDHDRATVHCLPGGFWHVTVRYGFMEIPTLRTALAAALSQGCPLDLDGAVYFSSRDEVIQNPSHPRLSMWQRNLFSFMYRNALRASDRFDLPPAQFVEVARQVAL